MGGMNDTSAPRIMTLSEAELARLIDSRILEHERDRHRCYVSGLEQSIIAELVRSQTPDKELGYGKQYLLALLDQKGRYGLERFIDKALEAIDEEGKLDIARNFDADERTLFEQLFLNGKSSEVIPQSLSRRQFISKAGRLASAAFVVEAMIPPLAHFTDIRADRPEQQWVRKTIQQANEVTEYMIAPTGLLAIAAHIHNDEDVETMRIRLENITEKLSHIEWAVDELAKASKKQQKLGFAERYQAQQEAGADLQRG